MSSELNALHPPDDPEDVLMDRFLAADERRLQGYEDWISCSMAGLVPHAADKLCSLLECIELLAKAGSSASLSTTVSGVHSGKVQHPSEAQSPLYYAGYRILKELGRGGFGIVYLARHEQMERDVAIKVPSLSLLGSNEAQRRFQLEARAVANLNHPNIVTIYEASTGNQPAIVYEYCDAGTLSHFVTKLRSPLRESAIIDVMICLADALRHAHSRGVLHRDIKPGNILICRGSQVDHAEGFDVDGQKWVPKLADFGLAKLLDEHSELTQTNQVMGTVSFMAPEQATGQSSEADTRTDIYSMGAVLYWLISGKPPFESATKISTLRQIEAERPQSPRRFRTDLSTELELVCLKSLEKAPEDRFETVADMLVDLRAIKAGDPISLRPAGKWQQLRQWMRYHRTAALGLAVTFLATLLFSGLQFHHNRQQQALIDQLDERNNELQDAIQRKEDALKIAEEIQHAQLHINYVMELQNVTSLIELGKHSQARKQLEALTTHPDESPREDFAWRYLYSCCNRQVFEHKEHQCEVLSSAVASSRQWYVTADKQGTICLRDAISGKLLRQLEPFPGEVFGLQFSPDANLLAVGGTGGSIRLYDTTTWKVVTNLVQHQQTVKAIVFTPDSRYMISGARDNQLIWWNTSDWTVERQVQAHDVVQNVCISVDGQFLVTGGFDGRTRIWSVQSGEMQHDFAGHQTAVLATAISSDNRFVAAGGYDSNVKVWDLSTEQVYQQIAVEQAWSISFPQQDRLLIGESTGALKLFDVHQPQRDHLLRQMTPHTGKIRSHYYLSEPQRILTIGDDKRVCVYSGVLDDVRKTRPAKELRRLEAHSDGRQFLGGALGLISVTLDRSGQELSASVHEYQNPVDQENTKLADKYQGHWRHFPHPTSSQNEPFRVGLIDGCDVRVESSVPNAESDAILLHHDCSVDRLAYSPDGQQMATVTSDGRLHLWQVNRPLKKVEQHVGPVLDLCFDSEGNRVNLSLHGGKIVEVNTSTGNQRLLYSAEAVDFYCVETDASGHYIAAGGTGGNVVLLDVPQNREVIQISVPLNVFSLAFTPDSRYLAIASSDIRLIDAKTGRQILTFGQIKDPGKLYECIAFSPQNDLLLAAHQYDQGFLEIWDLFDPWHSEAK